MKKLIRKGCFETNSSSTHSIVVARDDQDFVMDTIYPDQDGLIVIPGEEYEFGWEWKKYNDAITKLAYALHDKVDFDMLKEVVIEQTGAVDVIFDADSEYSNIDHQSVGTAKEVCIDKESTKNFIFNKNSWLFTGNDNSTPSITFYDVPEIKGGKMIMPRYKFKLVIEGFDEVARFKSWPNDEDISNAIESLLEGVYLNEDGYFYPKDDSICWQLSRPRNLYEKTWRIDQDYSNMEILFMKERDDRFNELEKEVDPDKKMNYLDKHILVTKKAREIPGLVKAVKFEITKI